MLTPEEIQQIITDEIEVDCYDEYEANMGWAIYLEEHINYPFEAEYLERKKSGEEAWKQVMVVNNKTDDSSFDGGAYYVKVELNDLLIPVRLEELRNVQADDETLDTIQIWNSRNKY
ncbi:MAG: calcium-binding protein [Bacteroidota bacterium]